MLRTKLFRVIAVLMLVFGVLSAFIGVQVIKNRMQKEAQERVQLDIGSAWWVYNAKLHDTELVLRLAAGKKIVEDACRAGDSSEEVRNRLEVVRRRFGMDFITVVGTDGRVLTRTAAPYNRNDYLLSNPAVERALKNETVTGTMLLTTEELEKESEGLGERAFMTLEDTPRARPTPRKEESRGMAVIGATPVVQGPQVVGAVYGGFLLNRNTDIVDQIGNIIYKDALYKDVPLGTATIFLRDARVATTVRLPNGNRAIGTRVSKEVADRVLDNGMPWNDRAFVVRDWYLTAYDPIRDLEGQVIGMLYVGILEKPFQDLGRQIILRYAGLLAFGLVGALVVVFVLAGKLAAPIHRLVEASERMHRGEPHTTVTCDGGCGETDSLITAFNEMADSLKEREARLKEANASLTALNSSYMDMLGFVSHELKSPVSSIMNYVYLLRQHKIGPLNEKQEKAACNIEANSKRLVEMVRHYLNLSRIESGELDVMKTRVPVLADVVQPLLDALETDIVAKQMRVENEIDDSVVLRADLNMTREAFENLLSNAVKYGRDGGRIRIGAARNHEFVTFSIGNEGDGVPSERIGDLFGKFSRIESETVVRKQKGTGLGLFITKHIVEAHGGKIEVSSTPGDWTEFRFTLPVFAGGEQA